MLCFDIADVFKNHIKNTFVAVNINKCGISFSDKFVTNIL